MPPPSFRPHLDRLADRTAPAVIGGLDPSFGTLGTLTTTRATAFDAVVTFANGASLAAGNDGGNFVVAKFLPNGALDTTFGGAGSVNIDFGGVDSANALVLDSSGRIVVVGTTTTGAGGSDMAVVRLLATGVPDKTFGAAGTGLVTVDVGSGADTGNALTLDSTGRIVLAGGSGGRLAAARLDANGRLDTTFGQSGTKAVSFGAAGDEAVAVFVVPNTNRIILGGSTSRTGQADGISQDFVAVRLDPNGATVDQDFGTKLLTINGQTFSALVVNFGGTDVASSGTEDVNGRYILAGSTSVGDDAALTRFDSNGNPDGSFGSLGKVTVSFGSFDRALGVYSQVDGKVVVAGWTAAGQVTPDGSTATQAAAARLLPNGSPDTTFGQRGVTVLAGPNTAAFGAAGTPTDGVVLVGLSKTQGFAARLNGTVGSPSLLLASGTPDGAVKQYPVSNGAYLTDSPAFAPFPGVASATRVAVGDVNGDGVEDRLAATGPGAVGLVVLYDGKTGALLANQPVFETGFTGGINLAAGDVNADGYADVVASADRGGGPRVRVFDGKAFATNSISVLADFFAIDDPNFRGGTRPALGDVNADGFADLTVSAGFTGGPRVAVWSGKTLAPNTAPARLVPDFFAFEQTLRDGAFVASGDVNGDGNADLVFGGGPNGGPRVRIVSGAGLLAAPAFVTLDDVPSISLANFFAGDSSTRGGVRVAVKDVDEDQFADLVTGSGENLPSDIRVYKGSTLLTVASPSPAQTLNPFAAVVAAGVFVG